MPPARPAVPFLASSLLSDGDVDQLVERACSKSENVNGEGRRVGFGGRLDLGFSGLEGGLDGVEGGRVVCVSCEAGERLGGELCLALLTSALLADAESTAAVIDTTGNFDVVRLYALICERVRRKQVSQPSSRVSGEVKGARSAEDVSVGCLERVRIMRVFDLVGVMEAVGEVRDECEGREKRRLRKDKQEEEEELVTEVSKPPPRKMEIADSEDEGDDDELLFDAEIIDDVVPIVPGTSPAVTDAAPTPTIAKKLPENDTHLPQQTTSFLLIDNLAHVVNSLLKKDYHHTQALLSTFLLSLSHLTRTHHLRTLLLNPSPAPAPPPADASIPRRQPPPPPSIFASNTIVPALMGLLGSYVDLHLMVLGMPKGRKDARVVYAGGSGGGLRKDKRERGKMVGVVEVVSDRWGGRGGAWGTLRAEGLPCERLTKTREAGGSE